MPRSDERAGNALSPRRSFFRALICIVIRWAPRARCSCRAGPRHVRGPGPIIRALAARGPKERLRTQTDQRFSPVYCVSEPIETISIGAASAPLFHIAMDEPACYILQRPPIWAATINAPNGDVSDPRRNHHRNRWRVIGDADGRGGARQGAPTEMLTNRCSRGLEGMARCGAESC